MLHKYGDKSQTNTSTDVLNEDYLRRDSNILEVSVDVHQEDERETAEINVHDIELLEDSVERPILWVEADLSQSELGLD